MTLATLRNPVRHKVGLSDNDLVLPNAIIDEAVNEALQSIAAEKDWPWLYKEVTGNTVNGTADMALPADYDRTVFLTISGRDVLPGAPRDLARNRTTSTGTAITGAPVKYTFAGANLKLAPTPNGVLPFIHAYYSTEPTLALDGDTPKLPVQYQPWLITRAALLIAVRTDNGDRLAKLEAQDDRWRQRVIDSVRRGGASPSIRRTKESIWQDV